MKTVTFGKVIAALALVAPAASVALAQGAPSPVLTTIEVRQLVASPAAADQTKLVAHFTALAERHEADAKTHAAMAQAYPGSPGNPRTNGVDMRAHCRRLVDLEGKASSTLRELAKHHASLAGGAASTVPARGAKYQAGAEAREPSAADLTALAATAASRADHRALQDYFLALAARDDQEAAGHAAMAAHYRSVKTLAGVAAHCDRLVAEIGDVAAEARAAATMHGTMAAASK